VYGSTPFHLAITPLCILASAITQTLIKFGLMNGLQDIHGLSECIGRAIQEHLAKQNINVAWPQLDSLSHPNLRVEVFLEDAGPNAVPRARSEKIASVCQCRVVLLRYCLLIRMQRTVDLTEMRTPAPTRTPTVDRHDEDVASPTEESPIQDGPYPPGALEKRRKGTGGLRVSQNQSLFQEDLTEHQRQMQVDSRSFPKRKKVASDKFVFQPSTLDKLIIGIWEQVHGSINLDPKAIFEQFQVAPPMGTR
jgi:ATP-dependent RNA helicase DDX49/DBP8